MSLEAVQVAIYERFGAQWNHTAYPVVAENQKWSSTQPKDKDWGRVSVRFASSQDSSVDGQARRAAGIVFLQIFVREEKGSLVAAKMSDEMERIFGRKTLTTPAQAPAFPAGERIIFERAVPGFVGKDAATGAQQFSCTVGFLADAVTP